MADQDGPGQAIGQFAKAHGLASAGHADLPEEGGLLARSTGQRGAGASGRLPGDIDGTLAHYTYTTSTTDSDGHTHTYTHTVTVAVTRIPESIGFAPFLGFHGKSSDLSGVGASLGEVKQVEIDDDEALDGCRLYAYKGTSDDWLRQLYSPALIDWLARSPDDFGFEMTDGFLVGSRNGHLTDQRELESLCTDTAHFAVAVRKESMEEIESGGAAAHAAKDTDEEHVFVDKVLADHQVSSPPAHASAAVSEYRGVMYGRARTWGGALLATIGIMLVINLFGSAITINLIVNDVTGPLYIGEAVLFVLIFIFALRRRVRKASGELAGESFFRSYAATRHLQIEQPLSFSATHAEAKLPFEPEHVVSGTLPGGANGSLVWKGDGMKREDRIAVVAGPKGPFADSELKASPPGLSATELDGYAQSLGTQLPH